MNDYRFFSWMQLLVLSAFGCCIVGLLSRGKISFSVIVIAMVALFIATGVYVYLGRLKATKRLTSRASIAALNEQRRKLVPKLKRLIVYLLIAFAATEWFIRNDPPLLRLLSTLVGLGFIGLHVWLLKRTQRSLDQQSV